jgi:Domain of unknown function (DUF222)
MSISEPAAEAPSFGGALASLAPSLELTTLVAELDLTCIDDECDLANVIGAWERLIAWSNAKQLAAIAEFARRPWPPIADPDAARAKRGRLGEVVREFVDTEVAGELAGELAISPGAAVFRVNLAIDLADRCRATAAALEAGLIDVPKARAIADGCRYLDLAASLEVEAKVLDRASRQTTAEVKRAIRRAVMNVDPVAAQRRCKSARNERGVWLTPLDDGVAEIRAVLAAEDALTVHNVLTGATQASKLAGGEPRTMDQLRADYLVSPFRAALDSGEIAGLIPIKVAKHRGSLGEAILTVPASVLMGVSDHPGELAGYGPVTADVARVIAGDCTWRRIITDPIDGTFMSADAAIYRPPAALVRHVELRDQYFAFLGCPRPATRCHLDHSTPHPKGGTCHGNLGPLCVRHHLFKHALDDALAHLRQPEPGSFVWTMPTGRVLTKNPPAIGPPISQETGIGGAALVRSVDDPTRDDPPPF